MRLSYPTILLLILLPIIIFFLLHGVVIHDEGYILNSSEKLLRGLLPYRDFHFVYTPGTLYATAFSFMILKPSILTSRILMLFVTLITCLLIYKTVIIPTKNKLYATLAVLLFASWGPTHINFVWPVMFTITAGILSCYLILKFLETRKELFLFFAGIAAFSVFLFKQNFGVAILLPITVFFFTKNVRTLKYISTFAYGYIWSFIAFTLYLLSTDSFKPFVYDLYDFTIQRIIINSHLATPFIYPDSFTNMLGRTLFYLIPIGVSLISFIILFIRRRFHLLFLPAFVASFYFFGIRPTTDYVHLAPLLAIIGIPIALFLRYNIMSTLRWLVLFGAVILIFLGFQTGLYKGYYRWDAPLIYHNNYFNNSRGLIFINDKFDYEFNEIIKVVNTHTGTNEYILINSYNPMLYFITNRAEPTKNNYLKIEVNFSDYYREVLGTLVAKKVKLLVLDKDSINQIPIKNYILQNYHLARTITDFDIYLRQR